MGLTPRRWRQLAMMLRITPGWWQESPVHQGEHEAAVKTVAQETPDDPALPVVTCSCAFILAREAAGAVGTRRFLHPLLFRGFVFASSGRDPRRGNAKAWLYDIRKSSAIHP